MAVAVAYRSGGVVDVRLDVEVLSAQAAYEQDDLPPMVPDAYCEGA